jgi:hypothetical protein
MILKRIYAITEIKIQEFIRISQIIENRLILLLKMIFYVCVTSICGGKKDFVVRNSVCCNLTVTETDQISNQTVGV